MGSSRDGHEGWHSARRGSLLRLSSGVCVRVPATPARASTAARRESTLNVPPHRYPHPDRFPVFLYLCGSPSFSATGHSRHVQPSAATHGMMAAGRAPYPLLFALRGDLIMERSIPRPLLLAKNLYAIARSADVILIR